MQTTCGGDGVSISLGLGHGLSDLLVVVVVTVSKPTSMWAMGNSTSLGAGLEDGFVLMTTSWSESVCLVFARVRVASS